MGDFLNKILPVNTNNHQVNFFGGGRVERTHGTSTTEYTGGTGAPAGIAQYKQEWIPGITGAGDSYYTNNPDKSKAYSKIPSFMMMA